MRDLAHKDRARSIALSTFWNTVLKEEEHQNPPKRRSSRSHHTSQPTTTFCEHITEYAGSKGFGLLTTLRRDQLPKGIPERFFHKRKTETNQRSKAARHLVVAVKTVKKGGKDFKVVILSFQSMSSTNFMTVNSLSACKNFIESRQRGRGESKSWYVIEQNMGRVLYLLTYSHIDSIDHLIKNARLFYQSWKYWHSPANHAKALAIVAAYDMYLECAEGVLDPEWKLEKSQIVSFHKYRPLEK